MSGWLPLVGTENFVISPTGVILATLSATSSVNQRLPSGPVVMPNGLPPDTGNSVIAPEGVILPIWFTLSSVNHKLPSCPEAIHTAWLPAVGTENSVYVPAGGILPIFFVLISVIH